MVFYIIKEIIHVCLLLFFLLMKKIQNLLTVKTSLIMHFDVSENSCSQYIFYQSICHTNIQEQNITKHKVNNSPLVSVMDLEKTGSRTDKNTPNMWKKYQSQVQDITKIQKVYHNTLWLALFSFLCKILLSENHSSCEGPINTIII